VDNNIKKIAPLSRAESSSERDKEFRAVWASACNILKKELSESSFKTWLEPVSLVILAGESATLSVPDKYYSKWLKDHYETLITSALEEVTGNKYSILYQVIAINNKKDFFNAPAPQQKAVGLNNQYTFDSFVIGPGNRFAHAAAVAVSDSPARHYNPLFVYGRSGLGKTHLLQAIAHQVCGRLNDPSRVLYISSEKFTNQLISAIQNRTTNQFRAKYRSLELLLIDDIHFLAEKEATQEEFFHTFNSLYDAHKQIVVSSDRPPREIPGLEERLVNRFAWGLVTDIQPPDFETRVAILKKKMEKETFRVSDEVSYYIADKIKSNIRELEGALIRVVAYGTLTGAQIDVPLVQEILKDSFREEEQKFSIEGIQRVVSDYFHLSISDLRGKKKTRSIARPRQIAMFLVRSLTSHSLPEIGEFFGGRDHTTVLHACQKISGEVAVNQELAFLLKDLENMLKK